MVWNKNDYIAAIMISIILAIGIIVALYFLGIFNPAANNTTFPFQ